MTVAAIVKAATEIAIVKDVTVVAAKSAKS
jgi:hypothetical protein